MKRSLKGSITIESSVLIPIVLFLIFGLIYLSFYISDIISIQVIVNNVMYQNEETDQGEQKRITEKLKDSLWVLDGIYTTVEESSSGHKNIKVITEKFKEQFLYKKKLRAEDIKRYKVIIDGIKEIKDKKDG